MSRERKTSVLWIEDNTQEELPQLEIPLIMSGEFDHVTAETATEALYQLTKDPAGYDVVIFDLSLGPGTDERFRKLYRDLTSKREPARLGLHLLLNLLGVPQEDYEIDDIEKPDWFSIKNVGILSVDALEDIIEEHPTAKDLKLKEKCYMRKRANIKKIALLELVLEVLKNKNDPEVLPENGT